MEALREHGVKATTASPLHVGDVVRLNSGGPVMVVTDLREGQIVVMV